MSIGAGDVALGATQGATSTLKGLVPKTEHHYIAGALLLFVGVMGIAGSVTGTLPAMIAGLFEPSDLYTAGAVTPPPKNTTTSTNLGTDLKPGIRNPFPGGQYDPANWISDL